MLFVDCTFVGLLLWGMYDVCQRTKYQHWRDSLKTLRMDMKVHGVNPALPPDVNFASAQFKETMKSQKLDDGKTMIVGGVHERIEIPRPAKPFIRDFHEDVSKDCIARLHVHGDKSSKFRGKTQGHITAALFDILCKLTVDPDEIYCVVYKENRPLVFEEQDAEGSKNAQSLIPLARNTVFKYYIVYGDPERAVQGVPIV